MRFRSAGCVKAQLRSTSRSIFQSDQHVKNISRKYAKGYKRKGFRTIRYKLTFTYFLFFFVYLYTDKRFKRMKNYQGSLQICKKIRMSLRKKCNILCAEFKNVKRERYTTSNQKVWTKVSKYYGMQYGQIQELASIPSFPCRIQI